MLVLASTSVGCPGDEPDPEPTPSPEVLAADAGPDRWARVGEPVSFVAPDVEADRIRWYFGDGEQADAAPGGEVAHTYAEPGHFVAFLELVDELGRASSDTAVVTISWPLLEEPPRAAAGLASSGDGSTLYAPLADHGVVVAVDVASRAVLGHADGGARPRSVAVGFGQVLVASEDDDRLLLHDSDLKPVADISVPAGCRPFAAVHESASRIAVACQGGGDLLRLDAPDWQVAQRVALGPDLRGLAWAEGELLVSRFRSPEQGGRWWRVDEGGGVTEHLLAWDPGPDSDTGARGLPSYLERIAVRPDGRVAALPGLQANMERGIVRDGLPLTHETSARATLRQVALVADEAEGVGSELPRRGFDDRGLANASAWSPLGDWLYTTMHGMETVEIVDAYAGGLVGAFQDVGAGPQGVWATDDELWVFGAHDRTLAAFSLEDLSAPQVELARIDLRPAGLEALPEPVQRGLVLFHRSDDVRMTKDGYISCGSCHKDGLADNRTWDFTDRGEGLRNTISLNGRAPGPMHWSANFDEVQDFENDIRGPQQGDGFLDEADWAATEHPLEGESKAGRSEELDDLAAYVDWLAARVPQPSAQDPALVEQGRLLFEDPAVGCADCHPAPTYTDSQFVAPAEPLLHDVGTLTDDSGMRLGGELPGLDTPTLRGLHESPPYLHDGSAATVREVLVDRNPGDEHGVTSSLGEAELQALKAFLLSL